MKKLLITLMLALLALTGTPEITVSKCDLYECYVHFKKVEAMDAEMERRNDLIDAIICIESNGNPLAYNKSEDAVGVLQIRKIMVREVNRLVGYKKYSYADRWNEAKSRAMFIDYQNIVNPKWDSEIASRMWNGGHYGMRKLATKIYWEKVDNKFAGSNKMITFVT